MDLRISWLGHASVEIELDGATVLTDPVLRAHVGPLVRIAVPPEPGGPGAVDAVLLSHLHADHADPPSLRRVDAPRLIGPRGSAAWLRRVGGRRVDELAVGEHVGIGPADSVRVTATEAYHDGRRSPFGPRADAVGYVARGSLSVYFAGDTDLCEGMVHLARTIDVALLPIAGWGRTLGPGHLDAERAAQAAAIIEPRVAIPIHWGTFGLPRPLRSSGDPAAPARRFAEAASRLAPGVEVRVLHPGERTTVAAETAPPAVRT